MNKISSLVLSVCLITTAGCSVYHIDSKDTTMDFYPSKTSLSQVVYLEKVDRPYVQIGEVVVNTERRQNLSQVIDKMRYEAAVLGGDAITDVRSNATGTWKSLAGQDLIGNAYVRANFTAKVIIFK
jgi:hypothetical protein